MRKLTTTLFVFIIGVCLDVFLLSTVLANELLATKANPPSETQLEMGGGVLLASLPDYMGASENKSYILPLPYIYYKSDKFEVDRNIFTGYLWRSNQWTLDLSASGSIAVNSDDNAARAGMADLDWVGEFGLALKYYLVGDYIADEKLYFAFNTHKAMATDFHSIENVGWTYGPSLFYQQKIYPQSIQGELTFQALIKAHFGDKRYLNYYYGISETYQKLDRPVFDADGGYAGSSISVGFTWKKERLWLASYVKYYQLAGSEQQNSALVINNQSWSIGIGVAWIFYQQKGK